jgi:tyrosine-protein kinase Etk/Wzc
MTDRSSVQHGPLEGNDADINILDLLIVLAKNKLLVLGFPFLVAVFAAVYSLQMPDIYTASTKILAPQQNQSGAAAVLAQMGGLAGLASGGAARSTNDIYVAMLKSRTVADSLIQRFSLLKSGDGMRPSGARSKLTAITNIESGKDGIITIEVDGESPKHAAELANAYVEELLKLTQVLAVTEASQRRLFYERQFALSKTNLANAEAAARQALESGGLVKVDDQGRAMVENIARLRAQMTVKEVQIGGMRTFAADRNPDLQLALSELESIKQTLGNLEGSSGPRAAKGRLDDKGMDNLRLLRNVKYYETIYELLAKQYEIAKIDEAKDSSVVQVMDKADEPDIRTKPKRTRIVLVSALAALVAAIIFAFLREQVERTRVDPDQSLRMARLKSYLNFKRSQDLGV